MNKFLTAIFMVMLLACKEEITPLVPPNNPGAGNDDNLPQEPVSGKYANCLSVLGNSTFDIATWNIENFPLDGSTTIALLTEMIETMDADVIAVQEITSVTNFNLLVDNLEEYDGVVIGSDQQRLGYIYKTSEISSFTSPTELFTNDDCAFPRPALKTTVTHVTGEVVHLINVHLKCCDDPATQSCPSSINRRKSAATQLKNYIDQNLANASVVVLGDFNEDITEPEGNGVFTTLINDSNNYKFADMGIATGPSSSFSYPSWPSHLDHLLITNELFDNLDDVRTIKFNVCESQYFSTVSDHYPVLMRLKNLN